MISISDIRMNMKQVCGDDKAILTDSKPSFEYIEGKRTEKVIGTTYIITCPKLKYEKVNVKVPDVQPMFTAKDLERCDEPVWVTFDGFVGKLYQDGNSRVQVSAKADRIKIAEEN